jgi:hypothetical protein
MQTAQTSTRKPPHLYATNFVRRLCEVAGSYSFVIDARLDLRREGVARAVRNRDTPALFNWLMSVLSLQGISDQVARRYIDQHGTVTWHAVKQALKARPSCPKLQTYWHFHDCKYRKTSVTCSEPDHLGACPLPRYPLRNGRLNQTAHSLFLFIRDVMHEDLVGWIDQQLANSGQGDGATPLNSKRLALLDPLRNVYGVSDKVLAMALSSLLISAGSHRRHWADVGASFVVVDTLVHNFLHWSGILQRFAVAHPYGPDCYRENGCADVIDRLAAEIDAREFNRRFPKHFPRFVQHAIWRYCAQDGFNVCNGNRINDDRRCRHTYCRFYSSCDRVSLR